MKNRSSFLKFFLAGAAFLQANVFGLQQKPKWNGTTTVENGIRNVKNPSEPLYGELKLELLEELSIGKKDIDEYSFSLVSDVKTDGLGNIYVADTKNLRVLKFDRNGLYVKKLGMGAVDFEQPSKIRIDKLSGMIFVKASVQRIEVFGNKDNYKNRLEIGKKDPKRPGMWGALGDFSTISENQVLAVLALEYHDDNPRVTHALFQLGSRGATKRLSDEFFYYALENYGIGKSESWGARSTGFDPELYLSKLDDSSYVYGYSKAYEINVIDREGKTQIRIVGSPPKPIFTPGERKRFAIREKEAFKPYFFQLLTDSKGRIYVQRNITKGFLNTVQENREREVDIIGRDGCFLYTSKLPANTCEIKDGYLLAYKVDRAIGLESIKRFRIKNWDEMEVSGGMRSGGEIGH